MTYEKWMNEIDEILGAKFGMSMEWLPDWLSRDCYNSGTTPKEGFKTLMEQVELEAIMLDEL